MAQLDRLAYLGNKAGRGGVVVANRMPMDSQPIIFIDSDEDDQLLFQQVLVELHLANPVLIFADAALALDYLRASGQNPFLIIAEVSLPGMSGLELRQQIDQDAVLRQRSIPFIFMTAPVDKHLVKQAYELTIQGLFEKPSNYQAWRAQLQSIIAYWQQCLHSKRFDG